VTPAVAEVAAAQQVDQSTIMRIKQALRRSDGASVFTVHGSR